MKKVDSHSLNGKIIDGHTHLGVNLKAYACGEYPFAQTAEGLFYRMKSEGVDASIVFPFTMDLFCDIDELVKGNVKEASNPLSPVPYQTENTRVMQEVYDFCPELSHAFIPFVCVDPARETEKQVEFLCSLEESYPIYGIKVNPVLCQSKIESLMNEGACFLEFARQRDIPFLFHVNPFSNDEYSCAQDAFSIAEKNPDIRFCFAHAVIFHEKLLEKADRMDNVWVDTAALTIQVELVHTNDPLIETVENSGLLKQEPPRYRMLSFWFSSVKS